MGLLLLPIRLPLFSLSQTQSRDEVRYRHTVDAASTIYRTEGFRAFFRGLFPSLLGILHVAVQFPLYEQLKKWARKFSHLPTRAPVSCHRY